MFSSIRTSKAGQNFLVRARAFYAGAERPTQGNAGVTVVQRGGARISSDGPAERFKYSRGMGELRLREGDAVTGVLKTQEPRSGGWGSQTSILQAISARAQATRPRRRVTPKGGRHGHMESTVFHVAHPTRGTNTCQSNSHRKETFDGTVFYFPQVDLTHARKRAAPGVGAVPAIC